MDYWTVSFTHAAREGTSAGVFRAGVSVISDETHPLPWRFRPAYFPPSRLLQNIIAGERAFVHDHFNGLFIIEAD
jgi:hypothetical protein